MARKTPEGDFQSELIKDLEERFEGCVILKSDPSYLQGFPDLLILHGDSWASLECKRGPKAAKQPNQDYYVEKLDGMSFAAFIFPENKEDVLDELQQAFRASRKTRVPKR